MNVSDRTVEVSKQRRLPLIWVIPLTLLSLQTTPARAELVAHWTFDTDAHLDRVYADSSGKNRPATVTGTVAPVTEAAPVGQAVALSGTKNADFLTTPYFSDLSGPGKSFSIAAWVKIDTGVPSVTYPIFSNWDKDATALLFWVNAADGRVRFQVRNDNSQPVFRGDKPENMSTIPVADDEWTHVAVVWVAGDEKGTKPGTVTYYVNGAQAGSMASMTPTGGAFLRDHSKVPGKTYDIGFKRDKGETLKGGLDDLRVYSHALTAKEIAKLVPEKLPDETKVAPSGPGTARFQQPPQPSSSVGATHASG